MRSFFFRRLRPFGTTKRGIHEIFAYEVSSATHLNFPYVEQAFFPNTWVDIIDFLEIPSSEPWPATGGRQSLIT